LFVGASIIPLTGSTSVSKNVEKTNIPTFYDTILSIQPSTINVEKGETFEIDIFITPGEPIIGIHVNCLYFDPNLVHGNNVFFYAIMGNPFACTYDYPIDNINGEIRNMNEITVGPGSITLPATWATIEFTAQQEFGTSDLELTGVIISGWDGNPAPVIVNDGIVNIPMDEDVNMDHVVHFMDLMAVSLHYNEEGDPGWIREDVNNDGVVHFMDLVQITTHYNEVW